MTSALFQNTRSTTHSAANRPSRAGVSFIALAVALVVSLILIAVGVALYNVTSEQDNVAIARQVAAGRQAFGRIKQSADRVHHLSETVRTFVRTADDAATAADELEAKWKKPEPPPPDDEETGTVESPENTQAGNGADTADDDAPTAVDLSEKSGDAAPPTVQRRDAGGREAPMGIYSKEELEAFRKSGGMPGGTTDSQAVGNEDGNSSSDDAGARPVRRRTISRKGKSASGKKAPHEEAGPPVQKPILQIRILANEVRLESNNIADSLTKASNLFGKASKAMQMLESAKHAPSCGSRVFELQEMEPDARQFVNAAEAAWKRAEIGAAKLATLKTDIIRINDEYVKKMADERAAAARKKALDDDFKLARTAGDVIRPLVTEHKYEEAVLAMERLSSKLKAENARKEVAPYLEWAVYLRNFRRFLISELNAAPFAWGWAQDGTQRDIAGADDKGLTLHGADPAPWDRINPEQMLAIVEHCLKNSKAAIDELARQHVAAALYCRLVSHEDAVPSYVERAAKIQSYLKDKANAMLSLERATLEETGKKPRPAGAGR